MMHNFKSNNSKQKQIIYQKLLLENNTGYLQIKVIFAYIKKINRD